MEDALGLLAEAGPEGKLIAGGQSLVPVLAYRLFRPTHLVDIDGVPGLDGVTERDGELELGALVRHARLEREPFEGAHALLSLAARHVGHVPIRTRGTLGGSLAHADPAAELAVAAVALEARIVIRSARGEREVPSDEFFIGPFTTAVEPDEMIVAVRVPQPVPASRAGFREVSLRAGDFALAAAGVWVALDEAGVVSAARVVLGAVEPVPRRSREAEELLLGEALGDRAIAAAADEAARTCDPAGDRVADAATRRELVAVLVRRALTDARDRVAA